jgi:hypothetical protein
MRETTPLRSATGTALGEKSLATLRPSTSQRASMSRSSRSRVRALTWSLYPADWVLAKRKARRPSSTSAVKATGRVLRAARGVMGGILAAKCAPRV